ncbi:MAG TPA: TIGR03809 family protein [Xanthobacteraceae bacterium]|nr:TIGR03809 family protein [Xanthobacteraceae bacterium]
MSSWPYTYALDGVAQKWRALAERRRAHFVELYDSGRWKRYYSEEQFINRMREAIRLTERWIEIAPRAADEVFAEQARAAAEMARRSAA